MYKLEQTTVLCNLGSQDSGDERKSCQKSYRQNMILWISLRPNCIYLSKGVNTADTHLTANARHYWLVSSTTICNYLLLIILLKTSHRWIKYWISVSFKHDLLFDSYIWCLIASLHLGDTLRRLVDTHGTQHRCVKLNSSLDSPLPFRFWYTFWIFSWESYPLYLYCWINLDKYHALKAPKSLIMSLDAYLKSASAYKSQLCSCFMLAVNRIFLALGFGYAFTEICQAFVIWTKLKSLSDSPFRFRFYQLSWIQSSESTLFANILS